MTIRAFFIAVLLTMLTSCGSSNNSNNPPASAVAVLPTDPITISGTITRVQDNAVMVEERPGEEMAGRKIMFTLTPATKIVTRRGADLLDNTAADLTVGSRVEAWAEGAIAESYPEQARAAALVMLDAAPTTTR